MVWPEELTPMLGNVGAARDQDRVMKQIVGCTVLLEDHYNVRKMLNLRSQPA
jgi:hypothetical protein